MLRKTKRAAVLVAAGFFLALGAVGLVLPVLQGWLFFAIAFILLSLLYPNIREWMEKHTRKYPPLHKAVEKMQGWIERNIGEV